MDLPNLLCVLSFVSLLLDHSAHSRISVSHPWIVDILLMVHQLHVSFSSNLHLCLAVYIEIIFTHLSIDISSVQFTLEYASIVWSPCYAKSINKIVQHRMVCFVFNDYDHTTSVTELLQ